MIHHGIQSSCIPIAKAGKVTANGKPCPSAVRSTQVMTASAAYANGIGRLGCTNAEPPNRDVRFCYYKTR